MSAPLMPKATAVWLIDNTSLTFDQIAAFTQLHILEIQNIADDEYSYKIRGLDPISAGQLTAEEIKRCEALPELRLTLKKIPDSKGKQPKKRKYTPLIKRQERPDAIHFLMRKYPELTDAQICKLIGTTKNTVTSIREKSHWKTGSFVTVDPVTSGFCTQTELTDALKKAEKYKVNLEQDDTDLRLTPLYAQEPRREREEISEDAGDTDS